MAGDPSVRRGLALVGAAVGCQCQECPYHLLRGREQGRDNRRGYGNCLRDSLRVPQGRARRGRGSRLGLYFDRFTCLALARRDRLVLPERTVSSVELVDLAEPP